MCWINVLHLCYGCDVWGKIFRDVQIIYRGGSKAALGIRCGTNNEIVYIESGKYPLESKIKRLQYKFWSYINSYSYLNPDSAIAKVLRLVVTKN